MKKNGTYLFIINAILILLLPLVIIPGTSIVAGKSPKGINENGTKASVQVKIPDGLYLYKPDFSKDAISPLVLVKNGKLLDPYTLAKEMGMPSFLKTYITNKSFYSYVGSELYGKISDLNLISDYGCITNEFVPYIRWVGRFEGKPLPHGWLTEKTAAGIRYRVFGSTRVIFAPQELPVQKKTVVFQVTESEMARMVGAVQKNLIPSALEHINKRLEKENRKVIGENGGRLYAAEAFDLDGNGKKDLVGVYYLIAKQGNLKNLSTHNIFFVLWDSGKIERIASEDKTPAYIIGGIIDVDLDGVQELILGTSVGPNREDGDDGLQIDILRYGPSGWTSVYRSKWICDTPLFYLY